MSLILSFDGGGALGTGPLCYLSLLEQSDFMFREDVLAGTSVGGIIALARALGKSFYEIDQFFTAEVGNIFAQAPLLWRLDPTRPKYQSTGLESVLARFYGSARASDVKTPFYVTTSDFSSNKIKVWTRDDDESLLNIGLATSAAPTYFQPRASRYVDGGVCANNPVAVGLFGAHHDKLVGYSDAHILSFATGGTYFRDPQVGPRTPSVSWLKPILNFSIDGNESRDTYYVREALDDADKQFLRISPNDQKAYVLDDLASLPDYRALWRTTYVNTANQVKDFITEATKGVAK